MENKYKAIIFDLDGVFIDTEDIHVEAVVKSFSQHGCPLDADDIERIVGRHHSNYVPEFFEKHQWNQELMESIVATFRKDFHERWDQTITLKAGSRELLETFKAQQIICSLATNSSLATVNKFIQKFSLEGFFSQLTTSNEVTFKKPHPDIYNIAKSKLDVSDELILVVEDSQIGMEAGKKAGLAVAVIPTIMTKNQDFSDADFHLQSISEVAEIIK
jgi:HAD superfamily hydrolase (TIGR01509 family)